MIETLMFAALLLVFAIPLGVVFWSDDSAALRRAVRRWRVRRQSATIWQHGIDLAFWLEQLRGTKPDRRIRVLPRHTLRGSNR